MSIVEATLFSLARAGTVALASLAILLAAGPGICAASRGFRSWALWVVAAALLTPGFSIAFLFQLVFMERSPGSREGLLAFLMFSRYAAAALLVVWLTPAGTSAEAVHCLRGCAATSWWRRRVWEMRAFGRGLWLGCAVVFLLAFQEFEFATTWNMRAWTVSLFDAQVGGLSLGESLRLAALPFAIQAALIAMLAICARPGAAMPDVAGRLGSRGAIIVLPVVLALGFAMSALVVVLEVVMAPQTFLRSSVLALAPWREIANSAGLSAVATIFAWLLAGWIEGRRGWRWLFALPGLLGPLLCGLMLLALLQTPPLHLLRDTIFPAVLGLALVLLPFALLLRFGIGTTRDRPALHVARAAGARRAVWQLDGWPRLCALLLLFCFGYGDFTINALLAPPQFTSAGVRLLNLMHYGPSASLIVMFCLAFVVPLGAALLTALAARFYPQRRAG